MPDSEPYDNILFDKDTDALCALASATLRLEKISWQMTVQLLLRQIST